jgi:hypothetical protein
VEQWNRRRAVGIPAAEEPDESEQHERS